MQLSSPDSAIRQDSSAALAGILADDDVARLKQAVDEVLRCGGTSALVARLGDTEQAVSVHAVGALRFVLRQIANQKGCIYYSLQKPCAIWRLTGS